MSFSEVRHRLAIILSHNVMEARCRAITPSRTEGLENQNIHSMKLDPPLKAWTKVDIHRGTDVVMRYSATGHPASSDIYDTTYRKGIVFGAC